MVGAGDGASVVGAGDGASVVGVPVVGAGDGASVVGVPVVGAGDGASVVGDPVVGAGDGAAVVGAPVGDWVLHEIVVPGGTPDVSGYVRVKYPHPTPSVQKQSGASRQFVAHLKLHLLTQSHPLSFPARHSSTSNHLMIPAHPAAILAWHSS